MSRNVKIASFVIGVFLLVSLSFYTYQMVSTPNLQVQKKDKFLYIPEGADFKQVLDSLEQGQYLTDKLSFAFLSKLMGYQSDVKPGAYLIKGDMTNFAAVRALKNGRQTPIKLTFNNLRTKQDLARQLSNKLAFGYDEILAQLNDPQVASSLGLDTNTITSIFIPNTYEVYWMTKPVALISKMAKEYKKFWTDERKAKAKALGMTQTEVSVLASIVECETKKKDEMPIVARVYKNRLDRHEKLQADPTVVFAVGDFSIKRVLYGHKNTDSPYNTYMYQGLPPGPIYLASSTAIDAVLNMPMHSYIFFCARPDFSGYHDFAVDYAAHLVNAKRYQAALDAANIH